MTSEEIRNSFFDFFSRKGHRVVPSAPMVIKDDPTLMFTNAGMNQFKDIFLGHRPAVSPRIVNTQKCLRVSGKHNDLEEVGHDTYHHTMFEMLGSWSFGDYFKEDAIKWAWEYLTGVLGLPQERLYATIFEGSPEENVPRDDEAWKYWSACFPSPENRILEGSRKDNFWEMGDTGPCGPCSEIHIDLRPGEEVAMVPGYKLVNTGHPLVVEIWNLVFIQYNRKAGGQLEQLPKKHVDTGMGFERLCMAVQGKISNYDTDIFQPIIKEIATISGINYGSTEKGDIGMRVVADHLRAVAFSIADGQMPSNNKAGYVIRRILRRAVRYGYNNLGLHEPFIYKLVPVLSKVMGGNFPELVNGSESIARVIHDEEIAFLRTLGKGQRLIEKEISDLRRSGNKVLGGAMAFELYDTYGFPPDLTRLILREHDMDVDMAGFDANMELQRERSREDAATDAGDWIVVTDGDETVFTGYDRTDDMVRILKYRTVKSRNRDRYQLVFDRTPFYAESGGQVGDSGTISSQAESIPILDTIKENNLITHIAERLPAHPEQVFKASVDTVKRSLTENNHSATHLLHYALREVLGAHVEQKGSLVNADRLRFDFSHPSKPGREELGAIENIVNNLIRDNIVRDTHTDIRLEEAHEMGAIALFGEKYGDTVRVVGFGPSVELCGGTHVSNTGKIGLFKIVSEGAIAAGIRRIEALTGENALLYVNDKLNTLDEVSQILNSTGNVTDAAIRMVNENSGMRRALEKARSQLAAIKAEKLLEGAITVGDISLITANMGNETADTLKSIASAIRGSSDNVILVMGSVAEGKATLVVMVSDNLIAAGRANAIPLIKEIAVEIAGKGGGQPFLAIAGGRDTSGIDRALNKAKKIVNKPV